MEFKYTVLMFLILGLFIYGLGQVDKFFSNRKLNKKNKKKWE